ncbi:MAG: TatD family hydrolase [Ghiorsea sp.]
MSTWVDSHCHLNHASFQHDLAEVLARANQQGIEKFVVAGTAFHEWEAQQQLQTEHAGIYNAYGIHPWFCDLHQNDHLEQLDELLQNAVAVGECGLDFMPNRPKKETQLYWFEAQLKLAEKNHKPLIIHSVKATDIIIQQLKLHPDLRGVIHGYGSSLQQAQSLIKLGFSIGLGTRLFHNPSPKLEALVTQLPLESLLLETDSPDGLGKSVRNEPTGLILVANIIAKLRNQDSETILSVCSHNAQELFNL